MADDDKIDKLTESVNALVSNMQESKDKEVKYPDIPLLGPSLPWINLAQKVGAPWVAVVLMGVGIYYGFPMLRQSLDIWDNMSKKQSEIAETQNELKEQATEAVPILQDIHKATVAGTLQRHDDIKKVTESVKAAAEEVKADKPKEEKPE